MDSFMLFSASAFVTTLVLLIVSIAIARRTRRRRLELSRQALLLLLMVLIAVKDWKPGSPPGSPICQRLLQHLQTLLRAGSDRH